MKIKITGGRILTMTGTEQAEIVGDIGIEDDKIVYVGQAPGEFRPDRVIDARNMIVMPGLVNSHTHSAMSLLRHAADDLPFWTWLNERILPLEEKLVPEDAYWGSMLSIAEMIRSGTTTFADMYFFMDETARAVEDSGIRANIARGLVSFDDDKFLKIDEAVKLFDDWDGKGDGRIHVDIAPHAPYTCSPEYLKRAAKAASELGTNIHTHISESRKEIETIREMYGLTPVEYMEKNGVFEQNTFAAHCVHLSRKDIDILSEYGVSVAYNPGSNFKLGNGFAPVGKLAGAGINISLGTDGAASNNNLNMFEEISLAAIVNKAVEEDPTAVPACDALKMATVNGASALGLDKEIGTLEAGKKADIILLDTVMPHYYPQADPVSSLVYAAQGSDVSTVICNGKIIMEKRVIKTFDENNVLRQADRIRSAMTVDRKK